MVSNCNNNRWVLSNNKTKKLQKNRAKNTHSHPPRINATHIRIRTMQTWRLRAKWKKTRVFTFFLCRFYPLVGFHSWFYVFCNQTVEIKRKKTRRKKIKKHPNPALFSLYLLWFCVLCVFRYFFFRYFGSFNFCFGNDFFVVAVFLSFRLFWFFFRLARGQGVHCSRYLDELSESDSLPSLCEIKTQDPFFLWKLQPNGWSLFRETTVWRALKFIQFCCCLSLFWFIH